MALSLTEVSTMILRCKVFESTGSNLDSLSVLSGFLLVSLMKLGEGDAIVDDTRHLSLVKYKGEGEGPVVQLRSMERAKQHLQLCKDELKYMSQMAVNPHEYLVENSFYEVFAFKGMQVIRVEPGMVVCTFKVPPRLTDRAGNMAASAIATLMDLVSHALIHKLGKPLNASINISISYLSNAKIDVHNPLSLSQLFFFWLLQHHFYQIPRLG